ncbi:MAG: sulfatase [Anaerolineae bacterium]|nr:sulfatase [Anaerolineae bacterium]
MARPNVILITPHDLGDFVGCYDTPVSTPNLDRIAAQGVIYSNHYSTGTVCSPSRGSIVTGCYPHTHGLMGLVHRGWALDVARCPPLPHILRDAGYQTHLFGFQHEHYDPAQLGYEDSTATGGTPWVDVVVPALTAWLRSEQAPERPFLAGVGFFDVHRIGLQPSHFKRDAYAPAPPDQVEVPPWLPDLPAMREDLADFYGDIAHMDRWIGELLRVLDETGLAENTLLIFTSDHGASFLHGKATLYEGGTRVPWIMRWPSGIPARTRVTSLTSHVDILPTILDLLQVPTPAHVQGQSMAAWARGEAGPERAYVAAEKNYTNYYDPSRMVRSGAVKYIRKGLRTCIFDFLIPEIEQSAAGFRSPEVFGFYSSRRRTEELYDLEADPGELHNLADDPEAADALAALRATMDAHLQAVDDPFAHVCNDLPMPEDVYASAMEANWRRSNRPWGTRA